MFRINIPVHKYEMKQTHMNLYRKEIQVDYRERKSRTVKEFKLPSINALHIDSNTHIAMVYSIGNLT